MLERILAQRIACISFMNSLVIRRGSQSYRQQPFTTSRFLNKVKYINDLHFLIGCPRVREEKHITCIPSVFSLSSKVEKWSIWFEHEYEHCQSSLGNSTKLPSSASPGHYNHVHLFIPHTATSSKVPCHHVHSLIVQATWLGYPVPDAFLCIEAHSISQGTPEWVMLVVEHSVQREASPCILGPEHFPRLGSSPHPLSKGMHACSS